VYGQDDLIEAALIVIYEVNQSIFGLAAGTG
jgi:hypothetical protein